MKIDEPMPFELNWTEVGAALCASKGITTGLWRIALKLRLAGTTAQFIEDESKKKDHYPTGLVGVEAILLFPTKVPGPLTFNAELSTMMPWASPPAKAPGKSPKPGRAKKPSQ